jgi:biotin carboxyl carrier protein
MSARRVEARLRERVYRVEVAPGGVVTVREAPTASPPETRPGGTAVATVQVEYLGHGRLRLAWNGRQRLAWAVDAGDLRWVFLDGDVHLVEIDAPRPARARAAGGAAAEALSAPMPATVVKVLATAGQAVSRGEVIVLLEAMKMELPLRAPHDAVVRAVRCAAGDLVQAGVTLVELEGR